MEKQAKLALVIGASSGVGAAAARELARNGYQVVLSARNSKKLKEIAAEIGPKADFFACDATQSGPIQHLKAFVLSRHGIPDVVVNSAGIGQWKRIEATSPEEAAEMIGAPYLAAFNGSHIFMQEMLDRRCGVLIHINSPACYMPWPSSVGYASARFALRGLHESLSQDLAGTGVHSCHLVFGKINSEYFDHNPGTLEKLPRIAAATIPSVSPETCARIIVRMAQQPKRQLIYPFVLRVYYWCKHLAPGLVRWLARQ